MSSLRRSREGGASLEREPRLGALGPGHAREKRRRRREGKAAPSTHPPRVPARAGVTQRLQMGKQRMRRFGSE